MSDELKEQTRGEQLRKALLYDKKNGYDRLVPGDMEAMEAYCTGYKQFLDAGKSRVTPGNSGLPYSRNRDIAFRPVDSRATADMAWC